MRVIIVGRDRDVLAPLVEKLTEHGFEVMLVENSSAVLSCIKQNSIQFLLADSTLLVGHTLAKEVLNRCPLARMVVISANPSLFGMIEAISSGLTDYFPRKPEHFDDVVRTVLDERERIVRWQHILLASAPLGSDEPETAAGPDGEAPPPSFFEETDDETDAEQLAE